MKKIAIIGILVLLIGTTTAVTDDSTIVNEQLTSSLGDFYEVSSFSNGIYTSTNIQNSNNEPHSINGDIYPYHWESNESLFIVKVTSSNSFYLEDFSYNHGWNIITEKPITTTRYRYCFLTNKTELETLKGIGNGAFDLGKLRYFQIQLGKLKLIKDYRNLTNMNGSSWIDRMIYDNPVSIPSGTWYFVFVGTIFNLDQDEVLSDISIWMNFSGTDLDITSSEGGKVYGMWFGEFNANLIVSKALTSETMIGGKTQFNVHDTFIYKFTLFRPKNQGFWTMKWITPSGSKRMRIIMIDGTEYGNLDNYYRCTAGIGESGEYKLRTNYYDTITGGINLPSPIYFVGIDVKLN
ncbi:MAG: hypothetical protein JSU91_01375 [Thermoplasmatales archaeon]|nr:MAG: hypothetical protein JSU91_01375 [Thermoplasmatales archaeon]